MAKLPPIIISANGQRGDRAYPRGEAGGSWAPSREIVSSPQKCTIRAIPRGSGGAGAPIPTQGTSSGLLLVLRERLQFRFFDVEVGVDVRNVFVVFQFIHQPQHLVRLLAGELHVILRHHGDFRRRVE
jgi:hypothetical protein